MSRPNTGAGHTRLRLPADPNLWLRRFHGVATRYLNRYLAWY